MRDAMVAAMSDPLKLAIVTDIHHGPTRYTKRGDRALPLLREAHAQIDGSGIDFVVELGDRISNVDRDTDRRLMHEVAAQFESLQTPRAHLLGNHDLHYLSAAENEDILGCPMRSRSIDLKGRHLVFWQHDLSGRFPDNPIPSPDELDWLRADLKGRRITRNRLYPCAAERRGDDRQLLLPEQHELGNPAARGRRARDYRGRGERRAVRRRACALERCRHHRRHPLPDGAVADRELYDAG